MADAIFSSFLIHTYSLLREDDGVGALKLPTVDPDVVETGNCWVKGLAANTKAAQAGMVYDADYKMYVVGTSVAKEGDVVNITSALRLNGTYLIQGVEPYGDQDGTVHHLTCFLKLQHVTVAD